MGKMQKGMCPFSYSRAREGNSECTGVVNVIKVRDKRTYVWAKTERTCVFSAIGVLSMSSKSGDKRTYIWEKAKRTCILLAIGEQEREIQNAQVNFNKVSRQKKAICRSASSNEAHA